MDGVLVNNSSALLLRYCAPKRDQPDARFSRTAGLNDSLGYAERLKRCQHVSGLPLS
jgi:hypothetical protein